MAEQEYPGQSGLAASTSEFNKNWFLVFQMLGMVNTCTLVEVKKCTNAGEVSPVGFVDVQPLINMVDGVGQAVEHGVIHKIPYFRLQGGNTGTNVNAVICDPKVGDIGIAVFAQRDISNVKSAKKRSNPGSRRRFSWADGIYIGGVLNGTPNRYVRLTDTGIYIEDTVLDNHIQMTAAGINIVDKFFNGILMDTNGLRINDKQGQFITMNSAGIKITDVNTVNTIELKSSGIEIVDTSGNYVKMKSSNPTLEIRDVNNNVITMQAAGGTNMIIVDKGGNVVTFNDASPGIEITPVTQVRIVGNLVVTGNITATNVTGTTQVTGGGKALSTHIHSGVTTGGGNTGAPV